MKFHSHSFRKYPRNTQNSELLPHLIIRIYQFAYKDRITNPLKKFFELENNALNSVLQHPNIAITLRRDEYLRKILLPIYTSNPIARKYLFEDFPDINNLTGSFSYSLNFYLNNSTKTTELYYANIYNVYSGFLSLDTGRIERFYKKIEEITPDNTHHPRIAGIYFACKYMYKALIKNEKTESLNKQIRNHLNFLRNSNDYKYGTFESAFYTALIITGKYDELHTYLREDEVLLSKRSVNPRNEVRIYRLFSKFLSGNRISLSDIIEIDQILSQLNPLNSYIPQIAGQLLKSSHYLNSNDINRAYEFFRNSTELSSLAGYRIIEVKLMKNLSQVLLQLGEKVKSEECNNFAMGLIEKTGFQYDIL